MDVTDLTNKDDILRLKIENETILKQLKNVEVSIILIYKNQNMHLFSYLYCTLLL
jgi:hypothetical protein